MTYYSPLRYPGGKGKISTFFSELFTANNLVGGTYIEPYVGGGSIALYLLMNRIVNRIIINDMDRSLFAFWHSVLNNSEEFCQLITNTPVTMETWHRQREIQRNKADVDLLSLGFSTFFLNRTNRSGIIKGGVIGGLNQTGNYLIDARYNPDKLRERIQAIARFSNHIELFNLDAVELVNNLQNDLPNNSLFYFDPPYYVKGKGLYMNYYNDQDHLDIYNAITQIENQKWIVTYDKVDFIRDLYINYRMFEYSLNYSAATVGKGKEYMILSDNCILPPVSPIKLSHNQ
jgi:DNA adenine methylase